MSLRVTRIPRELVSNLRKAQEQELEAQRLPPAAEMAARIRRQRWQRARTRRGRWIGLVAAAAVAAAIFAVWFRRDRRALDFAVGPAAVRGAVGAWVVAEGTKPVPLVFSDGTTMALAPETRARVRAIGPSGAEIALERGTLRAAVVPRPGGDWLVTVGPFDVRVKGTKFDVSWDPVAEAFDLTMHEGVVVVSGACLPAPRQAVANESLTLFCSHPSALSSATATVAKEVPSAASSDGTTADVPAMAAPRSSAPSAPVHAGRDAGEPWYASADEALAQGDRARLSGRADEAIAAYDAVRARFAGTDAAAMAAFHRGQVAFDVQGDVLVARRWFQAYLAERPDGSLAREALGRQLECEQRAALDAHDTAAGYLERFPDGPRADMARSVLAQ
ncbi:FecR domain-containing protein [Pendulispora albinea]|uniref:FecR family protein n=1 Tax=Pendulispora albinea TaxID=2741071 RepID=A0ABZ2M248_9BACT